MSVAELKEQIISNLNRIEDDSLLSDVLNLIKMGEEIKPTYKLSTAEKLNLDLALQDVKDGKMYSDSEAKDIMKKWLKE
ncbi:hypothetical protein A5893_06900 [Pedobacter psychrophilus]|uniref:Addiction module protein n=1 Tax=Pedobacter psychrophilus TaxID=1826909 RepID=A0A179DIP4_9SPHI|nr:hypothetical protein [Pedobacter psychrophilus]OAQ40662.1 hypothetical protein A5893_06900 [Pedobacter psychrophilus]